MIEIRAPRGSDRAAIRALLDLAFESPLEGRFVDAVYRAGMARCEMVAIQADQIVGHLLFTPLSVVAGEREINALALAPLSVVPARQRQGIGIALMETGLECCRAAGAELIVVLGHPDYYPRFGFSAEVGARLRAPWSGPAFMALEFETGLLSGETAEVTYPAHFDIFDT